MSTIKRRNQDKLTYPRDYASHGDEHPVQSLYYSWVCCILAPVAALAWTSTKRWSVVCGVTLVPPALAILQGAIGILSYREHFGGAPTPQRPSHGVVVVHPHDDGGPQETKERQEATTAAGPEVPPPHHQYHHHFSRPLGGWSLSSMCGCECTTAHMRTQHKTFLQSTLTEKPVRLLVIGDSLAIGVGQEKNPTPVMPEAIAKTISKIMGGRVVYWTCHGSPGASTGWIVREIERGIKRQSYASIYQDDDVCGSDLDSLSGHVASTDTEDSSSGEEESSVASMGLVAPATATTSQEQCIRSNPVLSEWKERLTEHRKRFDHPHSLGPYDVVVCLTGSNDLKGAVFPFLLTGEDAEFRLQAKKAGGFSNQLTRLMNSLNKNALNESMQRRLESIRQQVEVATESVREKVEVATETVREKMEETMEYISPGSSSRLPSPLNRSRQFFADSEDMDISEHSESPHYPLIILPGMPSRTLPCFQKFPLRLLSVPFCDVMDMHKRNFARQYPGKVLFVPPPSMKELHEYEQAQGPMWDQRQRETTVLTLRDIRRREAARLQGDMESYYTEKKAQRKLDKMKARLPLLSHIADPSPGGGLFCVDQIHPREDGYDFWGRYLGNAIAHEMQKQLVN